MEDELRSALDKADAAPQHAFKYTQFQDDPASTHSKIVSLVPPATHVLEFGCATGYMTEVLKTRLGCTVVGIEIDRDAAALAEQHAERVIVGDAETIDYAAELAGEEFDVVLFADVLEHLKEPDDVLRRVRPFVAENGVVIASVPNIAHASVRLALLGGEFRYREWGLLDDTHLRFFTRASIQDLFEETGYVVTHWLRQRLDVGETEIKVPQVPEAVREWLASDPEATTYQFVLRAVVSESSAQLRLLREEIEQLRPHRDAATHLAAAREELDELRPLRDEVVSLRAEIEAVRRAHEVQGQRLINERVAFAEGLAHVQATVYGSRSWRLTAPLRAFTGLLRRGR
ncbi:MAG: methyltransferase domain-containing protein [Actinobacteria bacterium]|nr:MAG: methyltransferase domain-containing protein [Actinomycetota bacterium]